MRTLATFTVALAVISAVSCQRYEQAEDGYGNEYADYEQPRPAHPSPRSYGSAPADRQKAAPSTPKPPVAILKQINRHNEDGSYTYGFEGADGSFKIETKQANGEVKGKYGFVDDGGKVRVVEYGANQYGFQPAGEGITVAPPTLVDETTSKEALAAQQYQDYDYQQPAARPAPARQPAYQPPQYQPPAQPQYETAQHTQAIYAPQQPRAQKPPIFTPAAAPQQRQSPLIQPNYEAPLPPSQAYNNGPVQFSPAPVQEPRGQPQPRSNPSGGILDQLARDYALPQGGAAPLHDISFGYY